MHPIGNHIKILPLDDQQEVRMEKGAYQKGIVQALTPDVTTPYKEGQDVMFVRGKKVINPEGVFINDDNVVLYK